MKLRNIIVFWILCVFDCSIKFQKSWRKSLQKIASASHKHPRFFFISWMLRLSEIKMKRWFTTLENWRQITIIKTAIIYLITCNTTLSLKKTSDNSLKSLKFGPSGCTALKSDLILQWKRCGTSGLYYVSSPLFLMADWN